MDNVIVDRPLGEEACTADFNSYFVTPRAYLGDVPALEGNFCLLWSTAVGETWYHSLDDPLLDAVKIRTFFSLSLTDSIFLL